MDKPLTDEGVRCLTKEDWKKGFIVCKKHHVKINNLKEFNEHMNAHYLYRLRNTK